MSKFPNQLALVAVIVLVLTAAVVLLSERASQSGAEEGHSALEWESPRVTALGWIAGAFVGAAQAQGVAHGAESPVYPGAGKTYGLGRAALPEEIAAWDIDIRPDGTGLPEGAGDVWTGEEVFINNCAACHGDFAEGLGRWPVLAGGLGSLTHDRPVKTVGSYWPYLSTVYDYIYRAMPFGYSQSLEPDEVYAITAYILYSNGIVEDDFELSHENFTAVRLPNEDNFFMDDRDAGEYAAFGAEPCMENCKESVEVTMRAAVLDVTPETEGSATEGSATEAATIEDEEEASNAVDASVVVASAVGSEAAEASGEQAPLDAEVLAASAPELVAAGQAAFRQCSACHQIGADALSRTGPHLNDVFGRTAGALDDFRYSSVMTEAGAAGLIWTEETLAAFLADPRGYMRGTRMAFRGFRDADDIAAVMAYLSTYAE